MLLSISFHYWKGISKLWKAERETEKTIKAEEGYFIIYVYFLWAAFRNEIIIYPPQYIIVKKKKEKKKQNKNHPQQLTILCFHRSLTLR